MDPLLASIQTLALTLSVIVILMVTPIVKRKTDRRC